MCAAPVEVRRKWYSPWNRKITDSYERQLPVLGIEPRSSVRAGSALPISTEARFTTSIWKSQLAWCNWIPEPEWHINNRNLLIMVRRQRLEPWQARHLPQEEICAEYSHCLLLFISSLEGSRKGALLDKVFNPIHENSIFMTLSPPGGTISKYHDIGD